MCIRDSPQIVAEDLGLDAPEQAADDFNLRQVRDRAEREAIVRALVRCENNILRAAELLGVSRPTLYDLMHRHAIDA